MQIYKGKVLEKKMRLKSIMLNSNYVASQILKKRKSANTDKSLQY